MTFVIVLGLLSPLLSVIIKTRQNDNYFDTSGNDRLHKQNRIKGISNQQPAQAG